MTGCSEKAKVTHPRVRQVCVVGAPAARWGEIVAAVIECETGEPPSTLDLHHHCRRHLAPYKTPALCTRGAFAGRFFDLLRS